jgi:hypothetical protein
VSSRTISHSNPRRVVYVAHPVAEYTRKDGVLMTLGDNLRSSKDWLQALVRWNRTYAFCMPWLAYVEACDDTDPEQRERGMLDDVTILLRCDELWLCGPHVSPGMLTEKLAALSMGMPVVDHTGRPLEDYEATMRLVFGGGR